MNLAIIGAGEMAKELYSLISTDNSNGYDNIFYVDLAEDIKNNIISEEHFFKDGLQKADCIIATGEPCLREKLYNKYLNAGANFTSYIHPTAIIVNSAVLSNSCLVLPNVYVSNNVKISENVLVHTGVIIENDCSIGNNTFINGNAFIGAKTKIGKNCFIGPNSCLRDSLNIGNNSIIGMGSVVTKSVPDNKICYGNPAIIVKDNISHKVFK